MQTACSKYHQQAIRKFQQKSVRNLFPVRILFEWILYSNCLNWRLLHTATDPSVLFLLIDARLVRYKERMRGDDTVFDNVLLVGPVRSPLLKLRNQGAASGVGDPHCNDFFAFIVVMTLAYLAFVTALHHHGFDPLFSACRRWTGCNPSFSVGSTIFYWNNQHGSVFGPCYGQSGIDKPWRFRLWPICWYRQFTHRSCSFWCPDYGSRYRPNSSSRQR